ncbi:class I SAM-dependent methyltransferase [bacterium]|nr:class I SAM-dependent methyltransferase [bacterium]
MKNIVTNTFKKLRSHKHLVSQNRGYTNEEIERRADVDQYKTWVPLGHYYSPFPSVAEIKSEEHKPKEVPHQLGGINLNEENQLVLLNMLKKYYREVPFHAHKTENLRYHFKNPSISYADAIVLYCMIRHLKPKRVIEIGAGYSSCVTLDTNELFFDNKISCTFIDPYPHLLLSLIKDGDKDLIKIIPSRVQDVSINEFQQLAAGDILFIDGSHVAKAFSDVNFVFFEILPILNTGVYIHFHDIFYPFEYPIEWLHEGRGWNEDYLLRAFLQYNSEFSIEFFNAFLEHFYEDLFYEAMPLCRKNPGGSIWIKKSM